MLYRYRPPNQGRWNGLGGKIAPDETPRESVIREIKEEAGLDLHKAQSVRFTGIVTWEKNGGSDPTRDSQGMYAFVAELSATQRIWQEDRIIAEGQLSWKTVEWVCTPNNPVVVSNIPYFLPPMLSETALPAEYFCEFQGGNFTRVIVRPLAAEMVI